MSNHPTPIEIIDNPNTQSESTTNRTNINTFSNLEVEDGRTLGVLVHILGMFTSFFGPLIVYAVTTNPLVKMHAKNALNFQISIAIYFLISGILTIILIGLLGLLACSILAFVLPLIATIKASDAPTENYPYPLSIQLIS